MPETGNKHIYYNLSIRVKADGFSFLVTEGSSGDNLHCSEHVVSEGQQVHELLAEKLNMPEIKQYGFSRVRIMTQTGATCIPMPEFCVEDLANLYDIVFPAHDKEHLEIGYTHLPQLDVVEVYLIPKDVRQVVMKVYPDATVTNANAVILGHFFTYSKRNQLPDNSLFIYTTPLLLYLFSIKDGKLSFANTYSLEQPQDSLFYVLSVWKLLKFPRKNHCYVAGEDDSVAFLTDALLPYLPHVESLPISIEL